MGTIHSIRQASLLEIAKAVEPFEKDFQGFNIDDWVTKNIAFINEKGDVAIFERDGLIWTGHYFFQSRAKEAVTSAKSFLYYVFNNYPIEVVTGLTPLNKRGALWLNKQLKLKSHSIVQTLIGPCELVMTTRQEWSVS